MITCPPREHERAKTLGQFNRLGYSVHVFVDEGGKPSPQNNRRNAERAVRAALAAECDLLFVEDDIDLAPDFPRAVAAAQRTGQVVTFWLERDICHPQAYHALMDRDAPASVGFYHVHRLKDAWYGTQAVLIPLWVLRKISQAPTFGVPTNHSFDLWLRDEIKRMLVALPNPVQHRNPPTLVSPNRRVRISPTFHLPRAGRWEEATWPSSTTRT